MREKINKVDVYYNDIKVGTIAQVDHYHIAFEYDHQWLIDGFSISPFSLPLKDKVYVCEKNTFDGVYGVFADSLPDGWGRLLVDRMILKHKINSYEINSCLRLAIVGDSGMGALQYRPSLPLKTTLNNLSLDQLSLECQKILNSEFSNELDELFRLGGSSGGARPKILTSIENEEWLVKFPSSMDSSDIGFEEYQYALCAKKCGIEMPKVRLFPSKINKGYFGVKRFDRIKKKRIHMCTVSALLETSHRIPNLDYLDLFKLTRILTRDQKQIVQLFRRMCFNVFAHNRDDHSKNFTFLYSEEKREWQLSPAYDLTYSYSINGEHATTVNGEGFPKKEDILALAIKVGIEKQDAIQIMNEIEDIVQENLSIIMKKYK